MREMFEAYELLMSVTPVTNKMTMECFVGFYCMLLEEWCKEQGQDINIVMPQLAELVQEVNEEEGRY